MAIRIPPPDPNDVIGPDAALVVSQATDEMTTWIETRVGELKQKADDQVKKIRQDFESELGELQSEIDALDAAQHEEIERVIAAVERATANLNVNSQQLREQVEAELEARNDRLKNIGRSVIDKAKQAAGRMTGLSVLAS